MMTFPIHPMGWLIFGLTFLAFGLWVTINPVPSAGPSWLSDGFGILFAALLLGMAFAIIAKTEKR